jgi:hypothetical protein
MAIRASGPRAARRSRIAATRPSGLNGIRRFSLSLVVAPGMPIWQDSQGLNVISVVHQTPMDDPGETDKVEHRATLSFVLAPTGH